MIRNGEPSLEHRAVGKERVTGPVVDDAAAVHGERARREREGDLGVLLDEQNSRGTARSELAKHGEEPFDDDRREAFHGLVEEQ